MPTVDRGNSALPTTASSGTPNRAQRRRDARRDAHISPQDVITATIRAVNPTVAEALALLAMIDDPHFVDPGEPFELPYTPGPQESPAMLQRMVDMGIVVSADTWRESLAQHEPPCTPDHCKGH